MQDHYLDAIVSDPTLSTPAAARALLELARRASPRDPDIAGDVVLLLTERLQPGGMIHEPARRPRQSRGHAADRRPQRRPPGPPRRRHEQADHPPDHRRRPARGRAA